MPMAHVNGVDLWFEDHGRGEPVVMVAGTGAPGRVWRAHQVPALRKAGLRVITVDNRGSGMTVAGARRFTLDDLVADVAALIEHLGEGPCRVVGHSLGGVIVQELLLARPDLVSRAVLMSSCGRADELIRAMAAADLELARGGVKLPPAVAAYQLALQNLAPRTLNDEAKLRDWLAVLEMTAPDPAALRRQLGLEVIPNRLAHYRAIDRPCLVIGFRDDLAVRPHLSRELAEAIPCARYTEIPDCGHYGYLERPDTVNEVLTDFLTA
ncbi:alpha/beta fold hydrolase [Streptomyces sp. NPDC087420]|uniref:alpha/beta fold hydrolase n=1 Tax=unclassified Streptomyces TaxID=2593676 RepID=UPI002E11DAF2|nr:alpha/beta hydrolase [Streptomyces sp. NBC_01317]